MRYRLLFVLLLAGLSACSFQAQVVTPPTPTAFLPVAASPTLAPPAPTSTAIVVPASATPTDTPLPAPTSTSASGAIPIRFAPGGTYVDFVDSIAGGTSKTYSIAASMGQVMSVSVRDNPTADGNWNYIPMQVIGANGVTLCPPKSNMECTFWRGVLPSTQNYFVTLMPTNTAANFTMRVAINPPGKATQSFQYVSRNQYASFAYNDEFAPVYYPGAQITKITPEIALEFIDTQAYVNTNLDEAYLLFGNSSDADTVANCTQPASLGGLEQIIGEETINGVTFVHSQANGAGAGNFYEQTYYRSVVDGVCYEMTFFVHNGNIGAYDPSLGVHEFDRAALMQKFESMLSTLVIK